MTDHAQKMLELAKKFESIASAINEGPNMEVWMSSNDLPTIREAADALRSAALRAIPREQEVKPVAWRIAPADTLFLVGPTITDKSSVAEMWRNSGNVVESLALIAPPSDSPGSAHQPYSVGALAKYLYENCGLNPPQHQEIAAEILSDYDVRPLSSISESAHQPDWQATAKRAKAAADKVRADGKVDPIDLQKRYSSHQRAAAEPGEMRELISNAIMKVVSSRDDLGYTHFIEIRDAVFAALSPASANEGKGATS